MSDSPEVMVEHYRELQQLACEPAVCMTWDQYNRLIEAREEGIRKERERIRAAVEELGSDAEAEWLGSLPDSHKKAYYNGKRCGLAQVLENLNPKEPE